MLVKIHHAEKKIASLSLIVAVGNCSATSCACPAAYRRCADVVAEKRHGSGRKHTFGWIIAQAVVFQNSLELLQLL
jgi:hypothetical protein